MDLSIVIKQMIKPYIKLYLNQRETLEKVQKELLKDIMQFQIQLKILWNDFSLIFFDN